MVDLNGSIVVKPAETTTYTLTASGRGGVVTAAVKIIVNIPPTVSISADPASIIAGNTSVLSWTSTNATDVSIDNGIGSVQANGSLTVSPTATTTYTVTATGPGGISFVHTIVNVGNPPTIASFIAVPGMPGSNSWGLNWYVLDAENVMIDQGIGSVPSQGFIQVFPFGSTTYTLTAVNSFGTVTSNVIVNDPGSSLTVSISADPVVVQLGESTTLTWNSSNAMSCKIKPQIGTVDLNGSMTVSPFQTTTYTIEAWSLFLGYSSSQVTVIVKVPVPTVSINADPDAISSGESSTLTWSSTNAKTCQITPQVGVVSFNGSIVVKPLETTTYTISVTGPGGTATASVTVPLYNLDYDSDGIPDVWEVLNGIDPFFDDANSDPDNDHYSNYIEYITGSDPNDQNKKPDSGYYNQYDHMGRLIKTIFIPGTSYVPYVFEYKYDNAGNRSVKKTVIQR